MPAWVIILAVIPIIVLIIVAGWCIVSGVLQEKGYKNLNLWIVAYFLLAFIPTIIIALLVAPKEIRIEQPKEPVDHNKVFKETNNKEVK